MNQGTFGSLFSFHRRPPLSHDSALSTPWPRPIDRRCLLSCAPRGRGRSSSQKEATNQYKSPARLYKRPTGRKAVRALILGIPLRELTAIRLKPGGFAAVSGELADVGQPSAILPDQGRGAFDLVSDPQAGVTRLAASTTVDGVTMIPSSPRMS